MTTTREWLERIEVQNARSAARGRTVIETGPFRALLDPSTDLIWLNYAVPVAPIVPGAATEAALADLRHAFAEHGRRPRFEFTGDLWPGLAELLTERGYELQMANPTMLCRPAEFRPVERPEVAVRLLGPEDADADLAAYLRVRHAGFENLFGADATQPAEADVVVFRAQLRRGDSRCALATLDGAPAGVGATAPLAGIAELAGVTTLPEQRRRGVAITLSSVLVRDHFNHGGEIAWLSAADDAARAVYEQIGFAVAATRLNYIAPA